MMYIIFNRDENVIGFCDTRPDEKDLKSRDEFCVEYSGEIHNPFNLVLGKYKTLLEPALAPKTQEQVRQELTEKVLNLRTNKLKVTDWLVTRHLEQKMLEIPQTLSAAEFNNLLNYRQQLRDITVDPDFPNCNIPELLI